MNIKFAIENELNRAGVPGASLSFIDKDANTHSFEFGKACLSPSLPVERDTVFHLFSGTKLYTAAALMLLVERGFLRLDEPVADHLPELHFEHPITVRHLATHNSGLTDSLRAFLAVHFPNERPPSTQEALSRYKIHSAKPPGRGVAYRNVNYAILGELISRVSLQPYRDFMAHALLKPLGQQLSYAYSSDTLNRAAVGYEPRLSPMRIALRVLLPDVSKRIYGSPTGRFVGLKEYNLDTAAIGGLIGSAEAFLPFLKEFLNPNTDGIISAASKKTMLTMQAEGPAGIVSRIGMGIGWKLGRTDNITFWNHEGGGAGFCSETRLYPDHGLGIVILMNRSQTHSLSRTAHRICEHIRLNTTM